MTTITLPFGRQFSAVKSSIENFFLKPASPRPLAIFRIGLSLVLLWQAWFMRKNFLDFFASSGFLQAEVSSRFADPLAPSLEWLFNPLMALGLNEHTILYGFGILYVASLVFVLFGLFTRWWAAIAWALHWTFLNTGFSGMYGADMYAHFFLFYLMWIPAGHALSLDRFFNRVSGEPTFYARLGLRALQLHMAISYFTSGIEKATGVQWWNGEVMWIALNTPGYAVMDFHWLARVPALPMVGGWIVLAIEIFYCVMVWPKKTRAFWVALTCLMHLGIAVFLNLPIFGLLMCVPTFSLFAFSAEPRARQRSYVG